MSTRGLALLLAALFGCVRAETKAHAPATAAPAASTRSAEPVASPAVSPHTRPASAIELAIVHELMRETAQLRGLPFIAPVLVSIEDRTAMRAYVERAIKLDQLERARLRYLALGALDPKLDVHAVLVALMEEELVGYYDPVEKRLAVRADIARALERAEERSERSLMWRATVVHELVHALQDQHFALGDSVGEERSTDADNAFGALVEGDATLAMLGYTAKLSGQSLHALTAHPEQVLRLMTRSPAQLTGALRDAPALIREPLLFRYRDGAAFCAELFRTGGWTAVDAAHRSLPASTRAIRHPQAYLAHVPENLLELPALDWLRGHAMEKIDEDVLGSLELSVILGSSEREAATLIEAWRADRYVVLRTTQGLGSLWWLRFVSAQVARDVAASFARLGEPARRVMHERTTVLVAYGVTSDVFEQASTALRKLDSQRHESAVAAPRPGSDNHRDPLATAARGH